VTTCIAKNWFLLLNVSLEIGILMVVTSVMSYRWMVSEYNLLYKN